MEFSDLMHILCECTGEHQAIDNILRNYARAGEDAWTISQMFLLVLPASYDDVCLSLKVADGLKRAQGQRQLHAKPRN